jgi:heme exporter protein D
MTMSEFFAMGGYGFYVWGAYGVTALLLVAEVIAVVRRRRSLLMRLGRMKRMNTEVQGDDETAA